jgi:hypothetical protein
MLHFAVESEANLKDSFYGRLQKGYRYDELALPEMEVARGGGNDEGLMTERVVGLMTGVLKHNADASAAVQGLNNLLAASGEAVPEWFGETFVANVKERMRKLEGEWNGTPFGETMTMEFS